MMLIIGLLCIYCTCKIVCMTECNMAKVYSVYGCFRLELLGNIVIMVSQFVIIAKEKGVMYCKLWLCNRFV